MNIQWHIYRNLELIPDTVTEPQASNSAFVIRLTEGWRSLVNKIVDNFSLERQVDHLEKCWFLNGTEHKNRNWATTASTVWLFLNQPIFKNSFPTSPEPIIRQLSDDRGEVFWCAYDPLTREEIFLESEEEVQIWLEERLYY